MGKAGGRPGDRAPFVTAFQRLGEQLEETASARDSQPGKHRERERDMGRSDRGNHGLESLTGREPPPLVPGMPGSGSVLVSSDAMRAHPEGEGGGADQHGGSLSDTGRADDGIRHQDRTPLSPCTTGTGNAEGIEPPKRKSPARVYVWDCQYCGKSFETTVYSQRYCSPTDKTYAYRERKRARQNLHN